MNDKPQDLHAREYAMQILENRGWPNDKFNLMLITECLISITKTPKLLYQGKNLTYAQAHSYMIRALRLADEQCVDVDQNFFRTGMYMKMRPKTELATYKRTDREAFEAHKRTPEYQADLKVYQASMAKLLGLKAMPGVCGGSEGHDAVKRSGGISKPPSAQPETHKMPEAK